MTPQTKRFVGEAIILIIYLIFDVIDGWPRSHEFAILSFVVGVSAVLFMELPKSPWMISTVVLTFIGILFYLFAPTTTDSTRPRDAGTQRAWLTILPTVSHEIKKDAPIHINLVLDNVGKEPATGVNHRGMTFMTDSPNNIDYAPELWTAQFAEIVAKQCELAGPVEGLATIFPEQKPAISIEWDHLDQIPQLIGGKKILVMYGCTGYTTAGSEHFTTYCLFLIRNTKASEWQIFNAPIGNKAT